MADPPLGPDGHHDDLDAADLDGLAMLVPDDPRSLAADRAAYLRELSGPRFGSPFRVLPLLPILAITAVIAMAGLFLTVLPGSSGRPAQAPLADPTVEVGQVGGLLPPSSMLINGLPIDTSAVRPAVIALIPADCPDCEAVVGAVFDQATQFQLTTVLVGAGSQRRQLAQLDRQVAGLAAVVAIDPSDSFVEYRPSGVTVLAVHADGVVGAVIRDVGADQRLESAFTTLAEPASG